MSGHKWESEQISVMLYLASKAKSTRLIQEGLKEIFGIILTSRAIEVKKSRAKLSGHEEKLSDEMKTAVDKFLMKFNVAPVDPILKAESEPLRSKQRLEKEESEKGLFLHANYSDRIRSLEDLIQTYDIDLDIWDIDKHVCNSWESTYAGKPLTLYQVKAWLKKKSISTVGSEKFLANLTEQYSKCDTFKVTVSKGSDNPSRKTDQNILVEIPIFDFHFAQACTTDYGAEYNSEIASKRLKHAFAEHLKNVKSYQPKTFLIVLGGDFFNIDNLGGSTTKGTPQFSDMMYQDMFLKGATLLAHTVENDLLKEYPQASVDVLIVPGNHDYQASFHLQEWLHQRWRSEKQLNVVEKNFTARKYYRFGTNLIGLTHGKYEAESRLIGLMPMEAAKQWSNTEHRYWHIGHFHQEKKIKYAETKETNGIVLRYIRTIAAPNAWGSRQGYVENLTSSCFIWHFRHGLIGELRVNY